MCKSTKFGIWWEIKSISKCKIKPLEKWWISFNARSATLSTNLLQGTLEMLHPRIITVKCSLKLTRNIMLRTDSYAQSLTAKPSSAKNAKPSPFILQWTVRILRADARCCKLFTYFRKCRYCDEPITPKNKSNTTVEALVDICNGK